MVHMLYHYAKHGEAQTSHTCS